MGQNSLLQTKLYIPSVRPGLVTRSRLIERLDAGLNRKLTLISAPAGFGKTTLLSAWVIRHQDRTAWLSLDKEDNDPVRFWTYLVAALQTVHAGLGKDALQLLRAPQQPATKAILTRLLNQITDLLQRVTLVLDDYHLISDSAIHEGIAFVLEHLPPQMHVAISTRADPPLPIHRLRAHDQLTELRSDDLRFTASEAAAFLDTAVGLDLAREDVETLEARTEGWIVGLQLAAISLQGRSDVHEFIAAFSGGHHYVLEYLTHEVVRRQPEPVQRFLMQTSILERLCGLLCDAVTGGDDGEAMLAHLRQRNLFIVPLDDEHRWHRYHHLFADLLGNLLRKEWSQEYIQELHLRACKWYEENGLVPEAVDHALDAEDFQHASELIERTAWAMLVRGEVTTLLRWLDALPDAGVSARSDLAILHAWALALTGELDEADLSLSGGNARSAPGDVAAIRGYIAYQRRETVQAIERCQKALGLLPSEQWFPRGLAAVILGLTHLRSGDPAAATQALVEAVDLAQTANLTYLTMIAMTALGEAQEMQGLLGQAVQTFGEALQLGSEHSPEPVPFAGMAYVGLTGPLYERNDLAEAMRCVTIGIELSEQAASIDTLEDGYWNLARLHQALGNPAAAREAIQEVERAAQTDGHSDWLAIACALQSQWWLREGNLAAASRQAQESGQHARDETDRVREIGDMAMSRVLLARALYEGAIRFDEINEATKSLTVLLQSAEAAMRVGSMITILSLQALAFQAQSDVDQAMLTLERALSLAESEGFVRTFVDEGVPMARLLQRATDHGIAPDYVRRLLAAFEAEGVENISASLVPSTPSLVEALTPREQEVLHLLGEGRSNREIAEALVITLNTVKKYTGNIYGKLGVHGRTQAVVRAQELGLL